MATREVLRTQLDALRVELQALQVENRKLREGQQDSVKRARELELTEELVAVREENLQLTQQLSVVNSQLDSEERGADAQAHMEEQVLELQQQVEEQATMVANQQQALSAAQEQMNRLQEQLEHESEEAEVARYRAVAQETNKWEARERQLVQQLDNLQQPLLESHSGLGLGGTSATRRSWTSPSNQVSGLMTFSNCTTSTTPHTSPSLVRPPPVALSTGNMPPLAMLNVPHSSTLATLYTTPPTVPSQFNVQSNVPHTSTLTPLYTTTPVSSQFSGHPTNGTRLSPFASTFKSTDVVGSGNVPAGSSTSRGNSMDHVAAALLAQQIPPLSKFSGDVPDGEGERFPDWKEQFELVAEACCWTDQSKLANLITRLRGQAYSYY